MTRIALLSYRSHRRPEMIYRNIKTGVIINSSSKLSGNWEPYEAPGKAKEEDKPEKKKGAKKK